MQRDVTEVPENDGDDSVVYASDKTHLVGKQPAEKAGRDCCGSWHELLVESCLKLFKICRHAGEARNQSASQESSDELSAQLERLLNKISSEKSSMEEAIKRCNHDALAETNVHRRERQKHSRALSGDSIFVVQANQHDPDRDQLFNAKEKLLGALIARGERIANLPDKLTNEDCSVAIEHIRSLNADVEDKYTLFHSLYLSYIEKNKAPDDAGVSVRGGS